MHDHPRIHFSRPRIRKDGYPRPYQESDSSASSRIVPTNDGRSDISNNTTADERRHAGGDCNNNKFAYAFLLVCGPPGGSGNGNGNGTEAGTFPGDDCRGELSTVVAVVQSLRRYGSRADMVLLVHLSTTRPGVRALPPADGELLRRMGVDVVYLPQYSSPDLEVPSYSLPMEKFRVLTLDQYDRVLYMDHGDVLPRCNLDYLLELSCKGGGGGGRRNQRPVLKENVVVAYRAEPASGGFFIVRPDRNDYLRLREIIRQREEEALDLPFPHWDRIKGWGHVISPPDYWRAAQGTGPSDWYLTAWTWPAAQGDDGLLYHWTKYVKRSVSIIVGSQVEQWGVDPTDGRLVLERIDHGSLSDHSCGRDPHEEITRYPTGAVGAAPYQDLRHWMGKPDDGRRVWHHPSPQMLDLAVESKGETSFSNFTFQEQWYWLFRDALRETGMLGQVSMDFISANAAPDGMSAAAGRGPPPPVLSQRAAYLHAKRDNGWRQYREDEDEFERAAAGTPRTGVTDRPRKDDSGSGRAFEEVSNHKRP